MRIGAIEDIYKALIRKGEVEFDYKDKSYIIEPILDDVEKIYLVIWTTHSEKHNYGVYIADISADKDVTKEAIDRALNAKCFDGKSFFEIEPEAELTYIFGID